MEREVDRFLAKTDAGKEYTIIQYQQYKDTGTFGKPNDITATTTRFLTSDGDIVSQIDSETFQIIGIDGVVRKV